MSSATRSTATTVLRAAHSWRMFSPWMQCTPPHSTRLIATASSATVDPKTGLSKSHSSSRDPAEKTPKKKERFNPGAAKKKGYLVERLRRRPSPSRARKRDTETPEYVLPDLGLTPTQLGVLTDFPEDQVLAAAQQLDENVYDVQSVMSPAAVELVVEELSMNVRFKPQTVPLFSSRELLGKSSSETRMPVITVMGHVDHGKTSLLDALRMTDVAKHERGGITQSVAAFQVPIVSKEDDSASGKTTESFATFIDTPGHAAFSAMRANGTLATDVVILVVAADDGVMPQTIEATNLARAANVPIIVAINKCDKQGADPERVRYQLLEQLDINTEQLGGDVQCVEISAKTAANLPSLLEAISLQAEVLDLRTSDSGASMGVCLESRIDRSLGFVATVIIRSGRFRSGDYIVFQSPRAIHGDLHGRIRSMLNSDASVSNEAGPGDAVGLIGIHELIPPGAEVGAFTEEKDAKEKSHAILARNAQAVSTIEVANGRIAEREQKRERTERERRILNRAAGSEEIELPEAEVDEKDKPESKRQLLIFVKGDVRGSADAVAQCVPRLSTAKVPVRVFKIDVGEVSEADVLFASAPLKVKGNVNEVAIIAFHLNVRDAVRKMARQSRVQILSHSIIYHLEDELKQIVERMSKIGEKVESNLGSAEVARVFEDGSIAGCSIKDGTIMQGKVGKVLRMGVDDKGTRRLMEVHRGIIDSIKQYAKSVRSVGRGSECGITVEGMGSFQDGDVIECISINEVP